MIAAISALDRAQVSEQHHVYEHEKGRATRARTFFM
jgi:hypothetical protein